MSDLWTDGPLAEAFDPDNEFKRSDFSKEASMEIDNISSENDTDASHNEINKFATEDNRYPIETVKQAARSLKRASRNEEMDEFQKVANKVKNCHPEIMNNPEEYLEKEASLGYEIGRNMAEGMIDKLKEARG